MTQWKLNCCATSWGYTVFEYHGNRFTADTDGVSVTVALAEPLDIEKPLADLDLADAEVVEAEQWIVDQCEIHNYEPSAANNDTGDERDGLGNRKSDYFVHGYVPCCHDYGSPDDQMEGYGGEEVFARAVPYLELGIKGLLAFCSNESQDLITWKRDAYARIRVLRKLAERRAQIEKAELKRVMPKRDPAIGLAELRSYASKIGINRESREPAHWRSHPKEGKNLNIVWGDSVVDPDYLGEKYWLGKHEGWVISQETRGTDTFNLSEGQVTVSERGYFKTSLRFVTVMGDTVRAIAEFANMIDALESLIPIVLKNEQNWDAWA